MDWIEWLKPKAHQAARGGSRPPEVQNPARVFTEAPETEFLEKLDGEQLSDWLGQYRLMRHYCRSSQGMWLDDAQKNLVQQQIQALEAEIEARGIDPYTGRPL